MDYNWKNAFPTMPESFHNKITDTFNGLSENKEMDIMQIKRKPTWKKAVVLAAVATMTLGTGIFAAGKIDGYIGNTTNRSVYTSAPSSEQVQEDYGFSPSIPTTFSNGYKFIQADAGKTSAIDEYGNTLHTVDELSIDYENDSETITLFVKECMDVEGFEEGIEVTQTINQIDIYYNSETYKLVPKDYVMTEQDKKDEESGKYVFSCGDKYSDILVEAVQSVSWVEDGIEYCILATDSELDMTEMLEMARDVIQY